MKNKYFKKTKIDKKLMDKNQSKSPSLKLRQAMKGFTFIEVIIVFTIIFIMTAVLLTTSYKGRDRKELQTVTHEVTAGIRETQNYALTGKQKGLNTMPCAFQYVLNSQSYQIKHRTRNINTNTCDVDFKDFFKPTSFPPNVNVDANYYVRDSSTGTSLNKIEFGVPHGNITVGNSSYDVIEITIEKNGKYQHLCLYPVGMIEDRGITENADRICGDYST